MGFEFLRKRIFLIVVVLTILMIVFLWHSHERALEPSPQTTTTTLDMSASGSAEAKDLANNFPDKASGREVAGASASAVLSQSEVEGRLRALFGDSEGLEFSRSGTGAIVTVMGELRKVDSDLGKIQSLLTELAGAYGIPADQLKAASRMSGNQSSELFFASQTYGGLDVLGGGVQTTVNRRTGVAFLAGAYLYPIQQIDMSLNLAVDDARAIVRQEFADSLVGDIGEPRKVIYAMSDPNRAELAYLFTIGLRTERGPQMREVVVGFASKSVVYDRPISYN